MVEVKTLLLSRCHRLGDTVKYGEHGTIGMYREGEHGTIGMYREGVAWNHRHVS